jgi:mannose-6-phosphate isomerase-like protein (cupin superfamily)
VLGEPDHERIAAVKLLHVEPRQMLSLQTHCLRRERWVPTTTGLGAVIGDQEHELLLGRAYEIPVGTSHRLFDKGGRGGTVIEIMYGTYDEDDIIRLSDMYDRGGRP